MYLSFDSHRTIEYAMHSENGGLRWIDDRSAHQWAEHTTIADSECATIHVLHRQITFLGLQCPHNTHVRLLNQQLSSEIFVNENENGEKRENNEFVNKN